MYWLNRNRDATASRNFTVTPLPAAEYLRMSDELQQYSIQNQKDAIREYAAQHGFIVVKSYADSGKSGVIAKNRTGLRELLQDVANGRAEFKAILVYDVSRWGRFPNNDEAAYYEFLCAKSGIPLHYCAEPFSNDGTAVNSLLKALKRSMAAEFSRELGEKVYRGKTRLVQLGYRVGGQAGYGYRRLMISGDGKPKQIMRPGERKSLTTDRTILVPGPAKEQQGIREMFAMAAQGKASAEIARELNRRGFVKAGRPWEGQTVHEAVTNPKYAGNNVWGRTTQRLHTGTMPVSASRWATKLGAFQPLVDQQTFDLAQARLPNISDYRWTDKEILKKAEQLLKRKGRISEGLVAKARNMPGLATIKKHFGTTRQFYKVLGWKFGDEDVYRGDHAERAMRLRRKLVLKIRDTFQQHVTITRLPKGSRSILLIDNTFLVSVYLAMMKYESGKLRCEVEPSPLEREHITLLCQIHPAQDRISRYYLFSEMNFKTHRSHENDPWLKNAVHLKRLSEFYDSATMLWKSKSPI